MIGLRVVPGLSAGRQVSWLRADGTFIRLERRDAIFAISIPGASHDVAPRPLTPAAITASSKTGNRSPGIGTVGIARNAGDHQWRFEPPGRGRRRSTGI